MVSFQTRQIGFWSGVILIIFGLAYLGLIAVTMLSGSGFPPIEPFQTMINILILLTAILMVLFWTILQQTLPMERKIFGQASLAFIMIFATLTSINRYVGLTVVRQSLSAGITTGLQWFLPYGWPSVMLAIEFLAWGLFFGLACLCLAPAFRYGKLEHSIFWILLVTGMLSLLAMVGQVVGFNGSGLNLFTFAGVIGWGPGLTTAIAFIVVWLKREPAYSLRENNPSIPTNKE